MSFCIATMSDVDRASGSVAEISSPEAVRAALDAVYDFTPKSDDNKIARLKAEAERLRKLRKENAKLQKNEKRKRSRIIAKGSGWDKHDILECFRLKHESELKRQRTKQERLENAGRDKVTVETEVGRKRTQE